MGALSTLDIAVHPSYLPSMIKTEMKGTGGGRWTTREDAKKTSRKARRENDRAASANVDPIEAYLESQYDRDEG